VALRCAGYNNVDLGAAEAHGITVLRVPAYSPHAVAEFTVGVSLALDRQICRGWLRVREDNFTALQPGDVQANQQILPALTRICSFFSPRQPNYRMECGPPHWAIGFA
jgi:lactate dehydrogenase-like 2-hydroxyacid dehydrogenase